MATQAETVEFILDKLGDRRRFAVRAMFGEYALYADGKTVALVCDDLLYVKIMPASEALKDLCETDAPYPGAKPHYVVTEDQLSSIDALPGILRAIAAALPAKKPKKPKRKA
jgi:TfoX/Sxy family transcriptional regulator of competence genes